MCVHISIATKNRCGYACFDSGVAAFVVLAAKPESAACADAVAVKPCLNDFL